MHSTLQDLKHAWRGLRKRPGFTATVLLTLGLGVGANTTIFSLVEGVLLRPLPYPDPDRLAQIWTQFPEQNAFEFPASVAEYADYRDESELFEGIAAYAIHPVTLTGAGEPVRLQATSATASLWSVLGVEAARGRTFVASEDQPGEEAVAVLGHDLWQRRFGADPGILGRPIVLDGTPVTVVGILPAGFRFPDRDVELWLPLGLDEATITTRFGHFLGLVGRMKRGVSIADVRSELEVVVARWDELYDHAHPMTAIDLGEQILGDTRGPLGLLLTATILVLLIACVNVAGLLLARGEGRRREISVRTALGAGRGRLARQLMTESVVLGLLGGLLGVAIAAISLAVLRAWQPVDLPRLDEVGIDGSILLFALAASLFTALLFGLAPALQGWRFDLARTLREGGLRSTAGGARQRLRGLLVVAEIALAVVLVLAAGLLLQSLWRLQQVDVGLDPGSVFTARISLPETAYEGAAEIAAFYRELLGRVETLPGVRSAALVNNPPFGGEVRLENFHVGGRPSDPGDLGFGSDVQMVSPDYFRTLGVPLLRGRAFTGDDRSDAPRVVILAESAARAAFPGENPIGRRITILAARPEEPAFEIVGVAGDVPHFGAADGVRPQLYLPLEQALTEIRGMARTVTVALKTATEPAAVAGGLRRRIWEIDPDLAISQEATLRSALDETLTRPRFTTVLLAGFGALALLLAAVGIYGLLSHLVSSRRRELGIRAALGASRRELIAMVVRHGLALTGLGLAIGMAIALPSTRRLETFLFETRPAEWTIFAGAPWVLIAAAWLASYLPARRAAAVDPASTLRED